MRTIDRLPRRHLLPWLVVAVAVVGGLLGMHALNLHASHAAHASNTHPSATHDAHAFGTSAAAHAEHACDDCDPTGGGAVEATACVLALLATLLLLPRPRAAIASPAAAGSARRAPTPIRRCGADLPPSRYALSVIRT